MILGQYNAAALTALANGGTDGAESYIELHVPADLQDQVRSTVALVVKNQQRKTSRERHKAIFGKDYARLGRAA